MYDLKKLKKDIKELSLSQRDLRKELLAAAKDQKSTAAFQSDRFRNKIILSKMYNLLNEIQGKPCCHHFKRENKSNFYTFFTSSSYIIEGDTK